MDWLSTIGATPSAAPHGTTALFDAIAAADKMLEPYQEGDAIYAITDGQDDHSVITAKKLEHELQRDRVRLYLFLLSDRILFEELQAEVRDVAALAANNGGFVFGRSSNNLLSWAGDTHYEFNDRIKQNIEVQTGLLIVQIGGFYRIDIANTGRRGTESRLSLHVVDEKGKQRKDVAVTFPRKILLCGEPQISQ